MDRLIAYIHLSRQASVSTRELLESHARGFAEREGYELCGLIVGSEAAGGLLSLRQLLDQVEASAVDAVLVIGPAREALVALRRIADVNVLTLAHVGARGTFTNTSRRGAGRSGC